MANPDRVELGSKPASASENHKRNGYSLRWLRTPAFAVRTFLAILAVTPGAAVAADMLTRTQNSSIVYAAGNQCNNTELVYIGTGFIDDPFNEVRSPAGANDPFKTNTPNTLDFGDIWMGSPQFSDLVVEYTASPKDPNAKWEEVGRYKMVNNDTFSLTRIRLNGLNANSLTTYLNGHTASAIDVKVYFANDKSIAKENPVVNDYQNFTLRPNGIYSIYSRGIQGPAITRIQLTCGEVDMFWEGRVASDLELEKAVKNPNFVFRRWGVIFYDFINLNIRDFTTDHLILEHLSVPDSSSPKLYSKQGYFPVSQEETRKAFQKYLDSKKLLTPPAAYTPIITPAPVYTPRPAATTTLTKEQTSTPLPRLTPSVTKKPEAAISPTPISQDSSRKDSDLPGWLLGLGAAFLAGLTANELYKRWRPKKGSSSGTAAGPGYTHGGTIGTLGGPPNPNTAPNTGPTRQKDPEWIIGQQEFETRWQAAKSKFSPVQPGDTGNEHNYILERFKAGMNVLHEASLDDAIKVSRMATRVRVGIEYLIPEIWPDNRIFKRFFDPQFNGGFLTSEDLAKIIYLPEQYRTLSKFTDAQRKDVRRIHRILIHALHPDNSKSEADPKLQDTIDDLLKKINPAWPYIDRLMK